MTVDSYHFMQLSVSIRLGYAQNMLREEPIIPHKQLLQIDETHDLQSDPQRKVVVRDYINDREYKRYLRLETKRLLEKEKVLRDKEPEVWEEYFFSRRMLRRRKKIANRLKRIGFFVDK